MPQFSRRTILAAVDTIESRTHAEIDRFLLEYGLENAVVGYSKRDKANALGRHLIRNPDAVTDNGENLTDVVVTAVVEAAAAASFVYCKAVPFGAPIYGDSLKEFSFEEFKKRYPDLHRGLEQDGFTVPGGTLRRTLPEAIDLPRADDEVRVAGAPRICCSSRTPRPRHCSTCPRRLGSRECAI